MGKNYFELNAEAIGDNLRNISIIGGIQDDGTDFGVVRTKLLNGALIKVPANSPFFRTRLSAVGAGTASVVSGMAWNSDGSGAGIALGGNHTVGNDSASASFLFYGSFVALRTRLQASFGPDFSVIIDNRIYEVPAPNQTQLKTTVDFATIAGDTEYTVVIADDLPDQQHTLTIVRHLSRVASSPFNQTFVLGGFILDSNRYKTAIYS